MRRCLLRHSNGSLGSGRVTQCCRGHIDPSRTRLYHEGGSSLREGGTPCRRAGSSLHTRHVTFQLHGKSCMPSMSHAQDLWLGGLRSEFGGEAKADPLLLAGTPRKG